MKVPIKFRGKDMNGHYVYGLLTKKKIRNGGKLSYAIANGNFTAGETIPVDENSIAQLVGYDAEGNEIYEGDTLVSAGGIEFTAELWAMGVNDLDADDIGGAFKFTLKGKAND